MKLLVANKANVNIWDSNGTTPLHMAAKGRTVVLDLQHTIKFILQEIIQE